MSSIRVNPISHDVESECGAIDILTARLLKDPTRREQYRVGKPNEQVDVKWIYETAIHRTPVVA